VRDVLVVDDELGMRSALEASFRRQGWDVRTAGGKNEALALFRSAPCPFVVTDMRMGDGTGLDVMQGVKAINPETVIVVLTAFGNVTDAVTAMKSGAFDYLIKPVSFEQLNAVAERAFKRINGGAGSDGSSGSRIVQGSGSFRAVLELARQIAHTEVDILIEAESGTGKEVLARFIHRFSRRSRGPFVAVNCASFPENLLESELFGHVRGAFTGATATKPGKFELANGGTLLLDEIGEMPLSLQPKLLRVLQEREVDRLGDVRPFKVDVRVIATTNQSLRTMMQESRFRQDLYYRLNVLPFVIPPLREHLEDVPELVEHFLAKYPSAVDGSATRFSPELLLRMQSYGWPGNIRELENFVRRALALSRTPFIGLEVLQGLDLSESAPAPGVLEAGVTMRQAEKELYQRTLEATSGNRTRAAEMLGVSLRTVRNKIRDFGLPARNQEVGYEHVG
jgi:two-component system response regulator AtoC